MDNTDRQSNNQSKKIQYIEDIIDTLNIFWKSLGSSHRQHIDTEVGAGTLHPATAIDTFIKDEIFYHYVQACRRPNDNRNLYDADRTSVHHQFQVICKPYLPNSQEIYLKSLKAIGISYDKYMIDITADNWQNPTIGAWGIGGEVACNGIEITQLTYFKQIGGQNIDIMPFEIAYGLERIGCILQEKQSILDVEWSKGISIRDILKYSEPSEYIFANSQNTSQILKDMFNSAISIANELYLKKACYSAYIYCTKASHYFNILDAQNAISNKDRQSHILLIRELVTKIFQELKNDITHRN